MTVTWPSPAATCRHVTPLRFWRINKSRLSASICHTHISYLTFTPNHLSASTHARTHTKRIAGDGGARRGSRAQVDMGQGKGACGCGSRTRGRHLQREREREGGTSTTSTCPCFAAVKRQVSPFSGVNCSNSSPPSPISTCMHPHRITACTHIASLHAHTSH